MRSRLWLMLACGLAAGCGSRTDEIPAAAQPPPAASAKAQSAAAPAVEDSTLRLDRSTPSFRTEPQDAGLPPA